MPTYYMKSKRNDCSSKGYVSGCNCNASAGMCAGSRECCELDLPSGPSVQKQERQRPQNSGCGRPRCARMTPPPEPKEKWEYPNYHFMDYGQSYGDRSAYQSQQSSDYEVTNRFNDYAAHNSIPTNINVQPKHPFHRSVIQQRNCQVRVAGGCDWPRTFNQDNYLDYHYDNVPTDEQNSSMQPRLYEDWEENPETEWKRQASCSHQRRISLEYEKRRHMKFLDVCERINYLEEQQRRQHLIEIMNASEYHFGDEGTKWTGSLKTIFELPDGSTKRNIALIDFDECGNKYLKQLSVRANECGNEIFKLYRIFKIDSTGKAMIHEKYLPPENCMGSTKLDQGCCPDILTAATTSELERPDGYTELSVLVATRNEAEDKTAFSKTTTLLDFYGNEIGTQRRTFIRDNFGNTIKQQEYHNDI